MKRLAFGLICFLSLSGCYQLDNIHYTPKITPAEWCNNQPCIEIANVVISQPTSSILVYLLAALSIAVGFYFLKSIKKQQSRFWWGISLLLGGVGAALAGTSYQAFGYEIKCAGNDFCSWTSCWEVAYNIFTVAGAGALLIAVAYSCFPKRWRKLFWVYAIINTSVYIVISIIGSTQPNKFLVSFELMLLFTTPNYIVILLLNTIQYFKKREHLIIQLIGAWLLLFFTLGAYYVYLSSGLTQMLWSKGIWFSENDVLHIGMIVWIIYIYKILGKSIIDLESKSLQ